MPHLYLLGTGAAWTDPNRTTTMLAVSDGISTIAIDCGGDVVQRLLAAGPGIETLDAIIITHEHADHVAGFPLFIERIWIGGRRHAIPVVGIRPAIEQARRCWEAFDTASWKDVPEIQYREVAHEVEAAVFENASWRITGAPVVHPVPIIGLRIEHIPTGKIVAYSADTEPTDNVVHLARNADILVHEANGAMRGHTTVGQAAGIASRAGAKRLLLVHLPPGVKEADLDEGFAHHDDVAFGDELGQYKL